MQTPPSAHPTHPGLQYIATTRLSADAFPEDSTARNTQPAPAATPDTIDPSASWLNEKADRAGSLREMWRNRAIETIFGNSAMSHYRLRQVVNLWLLQRTPIELMVPAQQNAVLSERQNAAYQHFSEQIELPRHAVLKDALIRAHRDWVIAKRSL